MYRAALGLAPPLVRLGAYWDEVEPVEGQYDWSTLDAQLEQAAVRGVQVVLTVGMKAPRYPEYFVPPWLEQRLAQRMGWRAWVTEAQAEPWEPGLLVCSDLAPSRSVTPEGAGATAAHLRWLGFEALLLWGVEHWHMRRVHHGDASWWDRMLTFFPDATVDGE